MKKLLILNCLFLLGLSLGWAQNLLPEGQFQSSSPDGSATLAPNSNSTDVAQGWRCFNAFSSKVVLFKILKDPADGTKMLSMEMTSNPQGEAEGQMGADLEGNTISVSPGEKLLLKFYAKQTNVPGASIVAILSGRDESGATLISQQPTTYPLSDSFRKYIPSVFTVPPGATKVSIIFNLTDDSGVRAPSIPCGVVIKNIDLEKVSDPKN